MKNGAVIVLKKELFRFFSDKRLFFTSVIMPGLLIYMIYSFIGNNISSMISGETASFSVAAVNPPSAVVQLLEQNNFKVTQTDASHQDEFKEQVEQGDLSLYIFFPDNFVEYLQNFDIENKSEIPPNVEIYYNSAEINSSQAYSMVFSALDEIEKSLSNVFDVNRLDTDTDIYDLAQEEDITGKMFSMILPMLLLVFIYQSCVSLAPESIAGEKERGTLAALLVTPIPRSQIIIGKVVALSIMSVLGGLSSFLGTFLSIPKLMSASGEELPAISSDMYGVSEYLWLVGVILSTVLLFVTIISILSTLAKSVKEAGTMVLPLMLIVMVVSMMNAFTPNSEPNILFFMIPIYNSLQSFTSIFALSVTPLNIVINIISNIVYSAVGIFVLAKMFDNEKIMFS